MACMGEMTALFPRKGPVFDFPRRFLDESIGLATGWIIWFDWIIIAAAEILAITEIFHFQFTPEYLRSVGYPYETLQWNAGLDTSPAIWVVIFLFIILALNMLPVLQYGRVEYVFGCAKIVCLVFLIMFNIVINAQQRFHTRFWTYDDPWGFATTNMTLTAASDGHPARVLTGAGGRFAGFWTAINTTIFSMLGWEVILFTAAENSDLARTETVKLSSRKIALRVILLYALATFCVGLNVPYTDDNLKDLTINGVTGGQNSIFIIAMVRNHMPPGLPYFMNAFFIFSACSTGTNALYSASRTLHALASIPEAWPRWGPIESLRSRLERTTYGVPRTAVFVSWLFGFLAFMSVKVSEAEVCLILS
jgi:amino acid transporter